MNRNTKILSAVLLLCGANLMADTKVQQLEKLFDADYKITFPMSKNLFKNELKATDNLLAVVFDINEYIHKNEQRYESLAADIVKAMTQIIQTANTIHKKYVEPVKGEVVMLNYSNWAEMKQLADQNLNDAKESLADAKRKFKNVTGKINKDLQMLVGHMIESFGDALDKLVNDFQIMRNTSKVERYTSEQATKVAAQIQSIDKSERSNSNKWGEIMDNVGLDNQVTEANENLAISKFHNVIKLKDGMEQIIGDLYNKLKK